MQPILRVPTGRWKHLLWYICSTWLTALASVPGCAGTSTAQKSARGKPGR